MPKPPILFNRLGSNAEVIHSVLGNNMAVDLAESYQAGVFGNAYEFAQTRTGGSVQFSWDTINECCWEQWIYPYFSFDGYNTSDGQPHTIFSPLNGWGSYGGVILFFWNGEGMHADLYDVAHGSYIRATAHTALTANTWYHVAMVWSKVGNFLSTFIDNNQVATTAYGSSDFGGQTVSHEIGFDFSGNARGFNGRIDNFKIYDYAKTAFIDRWSERGGMNDLMVSL